MSTRDLLGAGVKLVKQSASLKSELGAFTFDDVVRELEKPGRDPRDGFVPFSFRADIHELKDLQPGMVCPGIVTNVTNFGAFVDIGVHQDGLVHISQLADKFVKDPQGRGQRGRSRDGARPRGEARQEADRADHEEPGREPGPEPERERTGGPPPAAARGAVGSRGGAPAQRDRAPNHPPAPSKPATPFNNPFAAALAKRLPRAEARGVSFPQLRRLTALLWLGDAGCVAIAEEGSMRSSRPEREVDVTAVAHACFVAYVRAELAELGVRDADLADLCHEVLLVVQDKAHVVAVIDRLDLWLRAICRRVAADDRLRAAQDMCRRRHVA